MWLGGRWGPTDVIGRGQGEEGGGGGGGGGVGGKWGDLGTSAPLIPLFLEKLTTLKTKERYI